MKQQVHPRPLVTAFALCLLYHLPRVQAAGQCGSQSSNYGKALKLHTFDRFKVDRLDECATRCENEPKCQSINYVMEESICELNNRSKETRPDDYVTDLSRIYMTVLYKKVPIGSVPEVPAVSCLEMKAIQGQEAVSGYYWLDPQKTGKTLQTYCYIEKGSLFYWTLSGTDTNLLNLHGAAKFVEESGKTVLYLNGTQGTYAESPAIPFQQTDLTIAVWIKLVSPLSSLQEIYADWSSPWQFRFDINTDGTLCFQARRNDQVNSDVAWVCTASSEIVDTDLTDVWRHVAVTWRRATRKVRLHINGEVKQEHVVPDDPVLLDFKMSGHSVYDIGLKRDGGIVAHAYYSDLMVFTHELSETEYQSDPVSEVPAVSCLEMKAIQGEEAVSGYYWLDPQRTGETIQTYCHIGKGSLFYWTLSGTDTNLLNLHGAAKLVEENGKNVLYLDGTPGTYAETPAIPFQQTDLTIAVWIKLVSPVWRVQDIYGDWSNPWQFRLLTEADGRLCFQGRRNDGSPIDMIAACTTTTVGTDVWRHVAVTWGRADRKFRLYINGEVKQEGAVPVNSVIDFKMSPHSVYDIGLKRDGGVVTHAYFSDLMVFTHELSETEVKNELFINHPFHSFQ